MILLEVMPMKRAQIYLDDGQYEALRSEAFRRRASISAILRELIETNFLKPRKKRHAAALRSLIGMVHDTQTDVARRHDRYLWGKGE